jgi:hypothetical protein
VQALLAGGDTVGASPFADEYEVDKPEIEVKVPCLVRDADSSQFSVLVDIAEGKNVAVEGPPGTGKSQTIVNAIAAALNDGKKVIFVAEKLAALNVVKARLEAVGLGEFLLPLQADKSTREQVMESIRTRLDIKDDLKVRNYDEKLEEFRRARKQIADYIDLIKSEFGNSGLSVHTILGKSISTNARLSGVSNETLNRCNLEPEMLTASGISMLMAISANVENAHRETLTAGPNWKATQLVNADRFTVEEACALARLASQKILSLVQMRDLLEDCDIFVGESCEVLGALDEHLASSEEHLRQHPADFLIALLGEGASRELAHFIEQCTRLQEIERVLVAQLSASLDDATLQKLRELEKICSRASLSTIDRERLAEEIEAKRESLTTARTVAAALEPLIAACAAARTWLLDDVSKAFNIYRKAGREALALRHQRLAQENAQYHLRSLCEEGLALEAQLHRLSDRISVSVEVSTETLAECVSVLRSSGPLSFLSGSYRKAKRVFKSISLASKYSKVGAVKDLDDLIAFRRKRSEHLVRAETSGLFGIHWRGLETKYEVFGRLVRYYEDIDAHFSVPERTHLREFLRNAPVSQLDVLPPFSSTSVPSTFGWLKDRIGNIESEIEALVTAIDELRIIGNLFATPEVGPAEVQIAGTQLAELLVGENALNEQQAIRELLGSRFAGFRTKTLSFKEILLWSESARAQALLLRRVLSKGRVNDTRRAIAAVLLAENELKVTLDRLSAVAKVDPGSFIKERIKERTLLDAAVALEAAADDSDGLFAHALFNAALQEMVPYGVLAILDERLRANGHLAGFGSQIEALAIRQLAKAIYAQLGSKLTKYRGSKLDELRAMLAERDREIIQLSRRQLRMKVKGAARPPRGNGIGRKSTWTDMALIENEISKKQKYISVRDLTQRAGKALLELKPCWMMSPLAVAQYVPKGSMKFDLCIIDEASQMPPESAIGALLRCVQSVVVGDTNQLPPSSFFKTLIDDEDADEDETVLNESVLEMANGAFRPARRLRWHYRSRHSGLIKFSNRLIYDDNLIVFPSATEAMARMGVEFRAIKGRYKAGTNPIEAKAMVEATIEFMRTDPDRSLGVVTLNQKQRDLMMEEFEYAITRDRIAQKYIDTWKEKNDGLEEFFIKNLENVQGDERDAIFIGTVYGAEEPGTRVMQRFGPINGLAGKRRLNVLFTRAKQKIVTFSSMTSADIEADEHGNPGAYMLKRWLDYSASGILESGDVTDREPESDFEVFVMDQINAMGFIPIPQVGVAGYFIDIGVRHPDWPHGFVLGVECDGASYHSAKSARDRDRLRQEILEDLGWQLHRIWSTDWFNNSRQEAERLRKVLLERVEKLKAREHEYIKTTLPKEKKAEDGSLAADKIHPDSAKETPAQTFTQCDPAIQTDNRVEIGDTVRVRYLTEDKRTIRIKISRTESDPARGIVHHSTPIASALLGAELGDEVEVLVGSYIRPAVVEVISKNGYEANAATNID